MKYNRCYHKGIISQRVFQLLLNRDTHGEYLSFCQYKRHPGIVLNGNIRICEKRKCWHYSRYRSDNLTDTIKACVRKSRRYKNGKKGVTSVSFEALTDKIGQFIPYCSDPNHQGILINNKHEKCEKYGCHSYIKFRSPRNQKKACRNPIIIHCLEDLDPSMF